MPIFPVAKPNCGLERYLAFYREQEQRTKLLNRRGTFPFQHSDTVTETLVPSFEHVKQTGQVGQSAYDLLQLCVFLHPDAIPEEVIIKGPPALGKYLEEVIALLREFSLIRRHSDTGMPSIHRLVQTVLGDQMDTATRRRWAKQAVRSVYQALPKSKSVTWQDCQKYFSQPIFVDGLSIWEKTQKGGGPPITLVLENYAALLRKMNSDKEAVCLETFAKTIRDNYTQSSVQKD